MKLSIITPVYNVENYLSECIESILNQNFSDFELILINDGSTDSSPHIMNSYAAAHPDIIRTINIDNGGQGRARNFAIEEARGEYIGFVDSDDWITPSMFEKLYNAAEENCADVAACDYYRVEEGKYIYEKARLQNHYLSSAGAVWNKIFRRELIGDIRFPQGRWYEDFSFSAKLLIKSRSTVFVPEPLYCYRSGHSSTMRNRNSAKNLDMLYIMDDIREAVPEGKEEDFRFLVINHLLLDSIKRVSTQKGEGYRAVVREMLSYVKEYVPYLESCESYRNETLNRRIIMFLNYHNMAEAANFILKLK